MKKVDLIKLIEGLGDDDNVLETLKENEDIKDFAKSLHDINNISIEDFKQLLANNQVIKGYWTSEKDSAVSKGVESFKTKTMPKHIEEEIKKRSNEGKSPEQIQLEELQVKIAQMEKEKQMSVLTNKYSKTLSEKGLPIDLVDFIVSEDEEKILANIEKFEGMFNNVADSKVKAKLGDMDYQPPKGGEPKAKYSMDDIKGMSADEINKHWNDIIG